MNSRERIHAAIRREPVDRVPLYLQLWSMHVGVDNIPFNWQNQVPRVDPDKLSGDRVSESSMSIRASVQAARDIQQTRFSINGSSDIICNADLSVGEIRQFCGLQNDGQSLMRAAMTSLNLSARAYAQHDVIAS